MQKDDPLAHVKGECPGCLYLWSKCKCRPQPSVMETSVLDCASERQTLTEPRTLQRPHLCLWGSHHLIPLLRKPPFLWSAGAMMSPPRNSTGLRQSTRCLNRTLSPRLGLHGYTIGKPGVVTPAIKMTLQNLGHLLTSWSGLIFRKTIPLGCGIHGGLPPISLGTRSPRHNLQNSKKFRHK